MQHDRTQGAPQTRRYLSSTVHRYLDLPYTQIIQTHNSHRHNIIPPDPGLSPYPHPTYTTPQQKHRHTYNTPPVLTGLVKPKPNPLIHSPPLLPRRPEPNTYTLYILHQLLSSHAPHSAITRQLRYTQYMHQMDHLHALLSPHLIHSPHQHCHQSRTITLSQQTPTTVHASQSQLPPHPYRVPRQLHRQTNDDHKTLDTTQGHRPISKSERNLIILQVNINKNKHEELTLFIHSTHANSITIQETQLTPKENTLKVHNFPTVRADRFHKAGNGLITLIIDNITFTTTDIPSTINTYNT